MLRQTLASLALLLGLSRCSVEKLAPTRVVHHGAAQQPRRVVVLAPECDAAWCRGAAQLVASEFAFRGVDIVDLDKLPAFGRTRTLVLTSESRSSSRAPAELSKQTRGTVTGPLLADVDAIVRVRAAKLSTWPVRALAVIRVTRADDAELVVSSACQAELSRLDSDAEMMDRALRCAIGGLNP